MKGRGCLAVGSGRTEIIGALLLAAFVAGPVPADGPYLATGIKVGEVDAHSAIVWTRLTRNPDRNPADGPLPIFEYAESGVELLRKNPRRRQVTAVRFPEGTSIDDIRQGAPGASGQVRVLYRPLDGEQWQSTDWRAVDASADYVRQFELEDLHPGTVYELRVEARPEPDRETSNVLEGVFHTAFAEDQPARVVFTVSTGQGDDDQDCPEGFRIYPAMLRLEPHFFVHTGDILYYDRRAKTPALARWHWHRMFSWPTNADFHRRVASYFIKDDHDTWRNDCWPSMNSNAMFEFTFEQGQEIFREQTPMGERTYRTVRWGKDLAIWLVEGRDFRSPNTMPDGPEKTIWGQEQKNWFRRTVQASDATFRVLISPTPIIGPDRASKADNHANAAFRTEGAEIREFLSEQRNMVVVCGDRHWQYHSVHPTTGIHEFSCGPASDVHAGGWKQEDFRRIYHRYLKVCGGFLSGTVDRPDGVPTLTFRYHDVDGKTLYEYSVADANEGRDE